MQCAVIVIWLVIGSREVTGELRSSGHFPPMPDNNVIWDICVCVITSSSQLRSDIISIIYVSLTEAEPVDEKVYREKVGCLIYIMTATRPDLCYIVTKLSKYMSQPNKNHMIAAKHTLRYLKSTKDLKLVYSKSNESFALTGFCDS